MFKKIVIGTIAILIIMGAVYLINDAQKFKLTSTNVFQMDFEREWRAIQEELEIFDQDFVI